MKMNKTMLLGEVANRSGIPADECGVVLKTFERVLCEELTRKLYRYGGWILLLIGLFISAFAFGQISDRKGRPVQTIRGMVVDGDSKYPIPYATVKLSDKEGVSNMCDVAQRLEDRGIEKGIKEGISLGGNQMIYSLVEDKSISMEKGAQKLGISVEKLRANMINAGYKCPDME